MLVKLIFYITLILYNLNNTPNIQLRKPYKLSRTIEDRHYDPVFYNNLQNYLRSKNHTI